MTSSGLPPSVDRLDGKIRLGESQDGKTGGLDGAFQPTARPPANSRCYSNRRLREDVHEVIATMPMYFESTASRGRTPLLANTCCAAVQASVVDTVGGEKGVRSVPRLFR